MDVIPSTQKVIGHGAFSIVYSAVLRSRPNETVAIKAITKKNLAKSQNLLGKEIKILKELTELHHDNVVALLDCKETAHHVYLVMEYCNGGDLADYLNAKGILSEDTIRLFLRQMAGAISAMASKDIVHRDLKPQNILLHYERKSKNPRPEDIKLKIADFGFARFLQDGVMAATLCGSPMYMAPEVIMSLQYNSKADLWSLGTIVFQCLTGKAPFQAQTPQALKHYYEKNANLTPKIPAGTSKELTDLLLGLLKRNADDRLDFDAFFEHPFLRQKEERALSPPPPTSAPVPVPAATTTPSKEATPTRHASASPGGYPGLPPSPVIMAGLAPSSVARTPTMPMQRVAEPVTAKHRGSSASSPEADDFVMVPDQMTMDAAEIRRNLRQPKPSPATRRHTVSGANPMTPANQAATTRPVSLPVVQMEPQPVPAQRSNYQQIQQSLIRSRSKSGESISAMSGISSASGGSTLGPLPEEGVLQSPASARRERASSLSSPMGRPKSPSNASNKMRKVSGGGMLDIGQISPPNLQYTVGTPPLGHRRRTSSSSSCGTPPPSLQWTHFASNPTSGRISATGAAISPMRARAGSASGSQNNLFSNVPCLSPIVGSPNKLDDNAGAKAVVPWRSGSKHSNAMSTSRTVTVPEDLCNLAAYSEGPSPSSLRRRSGELQFAAGRNVVLNYGQSAPSGGGIPSIFERSGSLGSLTRRQGGAGKENLSPFDQEFIPPPDLSEETLMAPEHNEVLAKLQFIQKYVETIIEVARCKAAPLNLISETMTPRTSTALGNVEPNSTTYRRLQQLLLYMRCLHLLSQCLEFARSELKSKRLKPSTTVKTVLATLNERFRHCISMTKMLNSENLLASCGLDPHSSAITADRILYDYAIEQCQSAALDELFGNPEECFQRYHGAHILLHALEKHSQCVDDKSALVKYKDAVEKRLAILSDQGFVTAYETFSH